MYVCMYSSMQVFSISQIVVKSLHVCMYVCMHAGDSEESSAYNNQLVLKPTDISDFMESLGRPAPSARANLIVFYTIIIYIMYVCMYVCIYVFVNECMHVLPEEYKCVYMCMYACMHV